MSNQPAIDQRVLLGFTGLLLVVVGFGMGYYVGQGTQPPSQRASLAEKSAAGSTGIAGEQTQGRGRHTFQGVESPPHNDDAHEPANTLLAGLDCPCGDCNDELLACQCDVAQEIRGVALHLFTRGQDGASVAAQMQEHYGIQVPKAALAALRGSPRPEQTPMDVLEFLQQDMSGSN